MTNFNPNGTGTLLPNQYTNSDYSFVPPPPSVLGPAVGNSPDTYEVDGEQPPQNKPQIVDLAKMTSNKQYAGCYWFRIPLNYNNQGYKQTGPYTGLNGKRSDGALQSEMAWVLCLPTLTTTQGSATPPATTVDRITAATAFGTHVFGGYEAAAANLFVPTSATNPVVIAVAGYAPPGGVSGITAIRQILINGTQYLAICFAASGGGNTIQILSDLANPPTSSTIPVGATATWDIIQTAIDGNALLIYNNDAAGNGQIVAIRTDVGAGAVAVSAPRCKLAPGGYAVGLSTAEDSDPMAFWVVPLDGNFFAFNLGGAGVTFRGRLVKTDVRGYLPVVVDMPLRWVTYATKCRGGIVCCDGVTHWYLNKNNPRGKWRRMPVFDELPPNSNYNVVCVGHKEKDGKFLIETNEVAVPASSAATVRYTMEFSFDKWEAVRVSAKKTTAGAVNIYGAIGSAHGPWNPFSNYTYIRDGADTQWQYQQIFPLGTDLFGLRKTAGATAGTGATEFEGEESLTWPAMDIEGLEDCAKTITAITGPKPDAVAQGGSGAYVLVEELLSNRIGAGPNGSGAQFFGGEPLQRVQKREYTDIAWTYQIQPKVSMVRQAGGTDPTRYTPNAFNNQIFIEGIAVRDPVNAPVAHLLKMMDSQKLGQ